MPATLTRAELNRATLARQLLLERAPLGATEAMRASRGDAGAGAAPSVQRVVVRVESFSCGDVLGALSGRAVVRATLMRSTLHLMSAADYGAVRLALQPPKAVALRVLGARSHPLAQGLAGHRQGLDVDAVVPAARELLREDPLTFDEIRAALVEQFPDVNDRALGYAVRTLLPLVMVPDEDGRWGFARVSRFTLAEEWLDEPLAAADPAALVRRYLRAFGPASVKDAQTWSGVGALKSVSTACATSSRSSPTSAAASSSTCPSAPRPDIEVPAPPRFCRSSTTSCSPTTTARASSPTSTARS